MQLCITKCCLAHDFIQTVSQQLYDAACSLSAMSIAEQLFGCKHASNVSYIV